MRLLALVELAAVAYAVAHNVVDGICPRRKQLNGLCRIAIRQARCRRLNDRSQLCRALRRDALADQRRYGRSRKLGFRGLAHLDRYGAVAVVGDGAADAVLAVVVLVYDLFGLASRLALLVQHIHHFALHDAPRGVVGQQCRNFIRAHTQTDALCPAPVPCGVSAVATDLGRIFGVVDFDINTHMFSPFIAAEPRSLPAKSTIFLLALPQRSRCGTPRCATHMGSRKQSVVLFLLLY